MVRKPNRLQSAERSRTMARRRVRASGAGSQLSGTGWGNSAAIAAGSSNHIFQVERFVPRTRSPGDVDLDGIETQV